MGIYKAGQNGNKPWDDLPTVDFLSHAEEKTQSFDTGEIRRQLESRTQAQYEKGFDEDFGEPMRWDDGAPEDGGCGEPPLDGYGEYGESDEYDDEDLDYLDDELDEDDEPVRRPARRRGRGGKRVGGFAAFVEKVKAWLGASTVNKIIAIASGVVLVSTIVLVVVLTAGHRDPTNQVIGADEIESEIPDNYTFVDADEYAGTLLAKTDDAGKDYVKNTLFVGDSNFARMVMYGFLDYDNVIGVESMGIQGVTSTKSVYFSGYSEPVTVVQAIKLMQPQRMVICYGTNNVAANDPDSFIKAYGEAMDAIHAAYPYIDIIVCAIPPLSSSLKGTALDQGAVDKYNLALIDFAKERGYSYLDTSEVLKGSDGFIKSNYIYSDGVHLTKEGFDMFFKYMRTHAHVAEDTRPKPLNNIPTQVAPPKQETESKEFDPAIVASKALEKYIAAGCVSGKLEGVTPTSWSFTVPAEALPGEEVNWANSLYAAHIAQQGALTKGSGVVISQTTNSDKSYSFTVTVYAKVCAEHQWENTGKTKDPTCDAAGQIEQKCKVCGTTQWIDDAAKPAKGHTWVDTGKTTAASCEAAGSKEQKCSVCNKTQTVETTPALGHKWANTGNPNPAPTCTAVGKQLQTCPVCKKTQTVDVPMLAHNWGGLETDTAPTCGVAGSGHRVCTVCGTSSAPEAIPATGAHTDGNGDNVCDVCGATLAPPPPTDPTGGETSTTSEEPVSGP